MCLYSNKEYWIGEYDDYICERGMTQFINCATPGTDEQINCKLVSFTNDSMTWLAAKVFAVEVQEGNSYSRGEVAAR